MERCARGMVHGMTRVMSDITKLWRSGESDNRTFHRAEAEVSAKFIFRGQPRACHVVNITPGGACIVPDDMTGILEGSSGELDLSGYGLIPARVCYVVSRGIGLDFSRNPKELDGLAMWLGPPPSS